MEIRELARAVLFSDQLEDKLITPDGLSDLAPGEKIETPAEPARPRALRFSRPKARAPFPGIGQLEAPAQRGVVLHFFANHELLAMELMALVLLRFVDAPQDFRLGLAGTLCDEQRHLRMYRARMRALGVDLGSVPVNDFFWRCIAPAPRPIDFVARMSLTFEQANLDFTKLYAQAMRSAGDDDTGAVLDAVYEDEIRHVRHGVRWFEAWRPKDADAFGDLQALLQLPLTPQRAKGPVLDREGRSRAGLSEAFIDQLSVYRRSKGRTPRAFYMNPACEAEIANGHRGFLAPGPVRQLQRDVAFLMSFVAAEDDIVAVFRRPTIRFLRRLEDAGFGLTELVELRDTNNDALAHALGATKTSAIVPWGWSPRMRAIAPMGEDNDRLFSKALCAQLQAELGLEAPGTVCRTLAASLEAIDAVQRSGQEALIKAPFSSSGRERFKVRGALEPVQPGWIKRTIERQGAVIVEPWLSRVVDLSITLDLAKQNPLLGIGRALVEDKGRYFGHLVGRRFADLPEDLQRYLRATARPEIERVALEVARRLITEGVRGPVGIDAFIHETEAGYRCRPLVEINPRWTMGHIARAIEARVSPSRVGVWVHRLSRDLRCEGFGPLADGLLAAHPVDKDASGRIVRGVVFTTDPWQCEGMLTMLSVAKTRREAEEMLSWPK